MDIQPIENLEELVDWRDWPHPLAVVDLEAVSCTAFSAGLPPFPVIGVGDARSPGVDRLDVLVEPPVTTERLISEIGDNPNAAAVAVTALRLIEGMDWERALEAESLAYGLLQGGAEHRRWMDGRSAPKTQPAPPGAVRVERFGERLNILLDRPEAHNAIDRTMRDGLCEALDIAVFDPSVTEVHLRGVGRAFSMGAELSEFGTTTDPATAHLIRARTLPARRLARLADRLNVHVQGGCVGSGLEMAAFASRFTADRRAWFQLPELSMGIIPGAGGCVSVSRRIGRQRAALMILSGRKVNAQTALDWGLIDAIIDD